MKNYSLSTKVSISFALCIVLLFVSLLMFDRFQNKKEMDKFKERKFQAINYLSVLYQNHTPPKDIEIYFKSFGLMVVSDKDLASRVLDKGEVVFQRLSNLGMVSIFLYEHKYYLFLDNNVAVKVLLESSAEIPNHNSIIFLFIFLLAILIWVYVSTLKSIYPLKTLRQAVRKFASGNLDVECKSDRHDEIGELSLEFDRAVKTIRDLIRSRQFFLRTIMHELKTPIGKGRIVTEMVEDELQRGRLKNIFVRLEMLLNEFSKIEQLISKNFTLNKQVYNLQIVFEHAFDQLLLEEDQIKDKIILRLGRRNLLIDVDLDLMSLAFKNLIDNAIKYSTDSTVIVVLKNGVLEFYNKGEPLKRPIEELMQAFITTSNAPHTNSDSLGLGLYIVESVLKMHSLELQYRYTQDGYHCFYIDFNKL